jgi:ATP/maltotriose-dependent transcriptional regulator MalT
MKQDNKINNEFNNLSKALNAYLVQLRLRGHSMPRRYLLDVIGLVRTTLPALQKSIAPEHFAHYTIQDLIERTILGLDASEAKIHIAIYKGYYVNQGTYEDVATATSVSRSTIARRIDRFPKTLASQLFRKHQELIDEEFVEKDTRQPNVHQESHLSTKPQRRIYILKSEFKLTDMQAKVLLSFCNPGGNIGRRAMAKKLEIKVNTMKKHIREINRKLNTRTMNEAVAKSVQLFEKHPEADWYE